MLQQAECLSLFGLSSCFIKRILYLITFYYCCKVFSSYYTLWISLIDHYIISFVLNKLGRSRKSPPPHQPHSHTHTMRSNWENFCIWFTFWWQIFLVFCMNLQAYAFLFSEQQMRGPQRQQSLNRRSPYLRYIISFDIFFQHVCRIPKMYDEYKAF